MISAPNRSAWARISAINSGPITPSRWPGQFSTMVVIISWPPASSPSMTSGFRLARALYKAAVRPAGPEPITITLRDDMGEPDPEMSHVFVEQLLQGVLVGESDDLLDELATLE